jgi:hypothetical protein
MLVVTQLFIVYQQAVQGIGQTPVIAVVIIITNSIINVDETVYKTVS